MEEAINRLKAMLGWSDRIGSDEIGEIGEIISILKNSESFTKKDMEQAFIAGGKASRDINNPGFDEFLETMNKCEFSGTNICSIDDRNPSQCTECQKQFKK